MNRRRPARRTSNTASFAARVTTACLFPVVALQLSYGVAVADSAGVGDASCEFTLSDPYVERISGVDMVTATVSPYPCGASAQPDKSVVCIGELGGTAPPVCDQKNTQNVPAKAYFSPYRPGATYVSSGTGCIGFYDPPFGACVSLGPQSGTP